MYSVLYSAVQCVLIAHHYVLYIAILYRAVQCTLYIMNHDILCSEYCILYTV